jgi:hypothetical protein
MNGTGPRVSGFEMALISGIVEIDFDALSSLTLGRRIVVVHEWM